MTDQFSIIGAGIGGLTTALTLQRKGFDVALYESADEIKPVGAGIVLAMNAMQVMKKLGLRERLESVGHRLSVMKITDQQLRVLSVADLSSFEKKYGVNNLAIHRGELQKILAEEIGYDKINLSKRLTTIEKDTPYRLTFEDGTTIQTKILIGADGIKSVVRNQLFSENTIRNAHQICWRGVGEMDLPESYHHEANEAWGQGKRFGFVKISHQKMYWYALINAKNHQENGTDLLELFKDFHPDILAIIRATPQSQIITSDITDLLPIKKWQAANVCLIGDAAHATTPNLGQGACQAIEDAYVLGKYLTAQTEVQTAFQNYEKLRRKKAHTIVNQSWQLGKLAHLENSVGVWCRNNLMKWMPEFVSRRQLEMIFRLN